MPLYVAGLTTGARIGELGGLCWSDLDLDRRVVRIQRALITGRGGQTCEPPKTSNSRRSIGLSQRAVDALERHQEHQSAEGFPVEGDSLVFTNTVGSPSTRRIFFVARSSHYWQRLVCQGPRFTLRHVTRSAVWPCSRV